MLVTDSIKKFKNGAEIVYFVSVLVASCIFILIFVAGNIEAKGLENGAIREGRVDK